MVINGLVDKLITRKGSMLAFRARLMRDSKTSRVDVLSTQSV